MKKTVYRYRIIRDKKSNKIKVEKVTDQKTRRTISTDKVVNNITIQERVKRNKIGCGQNMNFETLPRLPNIEKILLEWYNVHTIEEVIIRFQQDEELERTRRELEWRCRYSFLGFRW